MKKRGNEQGAIVIEAIISLVVYMFAIFTILTIVDVCYTQARVSIALNSAARDISKYTYLYYKFGIDDAEKKLNDEAEESKSMADATLDGIGNLMSAFTDTKEADNLEDFKSGIDGIKTAGGTLVEIGESAADRFADDPKQFMVGMAALAGQELAEEAKVALAQYMGRAFMKKNLMAYEGDDADSFLKRHRVVDGIDGLDFKGSTLMYAGSTDKIMLVVTYDIKVIKLLNIDFTFRIKQVAQTKAWGNGTSNKVTVSTEGS